MPNVTEKILEGSYDECQVWWSSPHLLSAASRDFNTARHRNFTVVPILWRTTCPSGAAGEEDEVEGWRNFTSLQLCSEQLLYSWVVALHCTSFQLQWNSHEKLSLLPPCPPTAATPVGEVMWGDAAGRLQEPRSGAVCSLALGSMCCPTGKPGQAALPGIAVTEGKRSQNSP